MPQMTLQLLLHSPGWVKLISHHLLPLTPPPVMLVTHLPRMLPARGHFYKHKTPDVRTVLLPCITHRYPLPVLQVGGDREGRIKGILYMAEGKNLGISMFIISVVLE